MALAVAAMAKKQPDPTCTYTSTKIDDEVLPIVKAAAALKRQDVQDYLSDVLNEAASREIGREPIKRRPLRPTKKPGKKPRG